MRKIEQQMLNAVQNKLDWSKDNTRVEYVQEVDSSCIRLYEHIIATFNHYTNTLITNKDVLLEWPAVTTKSRLRALGADLKQSKGILYLNGESI